MDVSERILQTWMLIHAGMTEETAGISLLFMFAPA
jgi:hypothetical protein